MLVIVNLAPGFLVHMGCFALLLTCHMDLEMENEQ